MDILRDPFPLLANSEDIHPLEGITSIPSHTQDDPIGVQSEATLIGDPDIFDYANRLRYFSERRNEANILTRELGVSFENLSVVGVGASASWQETLGSVLNPKNFLEAVRSLRHPPLREILSGFEGVVRPTEMLLVLGSPGSGCSTLLKILANQRDDYRSVTGEVHYDSLSPQEVLEHYRGDVQYCPEDDIHFPTLTVEQTIKFAIKTRTPHMRLTQSHEQYVSYAAEFLMAVMRLRHARNTLVGDAAIRGVSGGEKKRVSIAEALATRSRVCSWDNATRGLDSSTALEFGRALRVATDLDRLSTIVSVYQAGETLYSLFDKVAVLYKGKMAYFGPAEQAKNYFMSMGYEPATRQTTPDFLVSVTDPLARIPRAGFTNQPRSAGEFARHFLNSHIGHQNKEDIQLYKNEFVGVRKRKEHYSRSVAAEHAIHTRKSSPYTISLFMQARAVILRRVQILIGSPTVVIFNILVFIIQGILVGTMFLKISETTSTFFSRGGLLFCTLLCCALTSMAEIPSLYAQRPIVSRHHKAGLYHPSIEALALTLVDIPVTFLSTMIYSVLIYFLVRLQQSAEQFFIFYLFVFTTTLTMKVQFRALAAACKTEEIAQAVAGVWLLTEILYLGYAVPKPLMIGALEWISYLNPLQYAFEAVIANEFHTLMGACTTLIPQGPSYKDITLQNQVCTTVGAVSGQDFVDGNRYISLFYGYTHDHLWRNFVILVAFGCAFFMALLVFTEYLTANTYLASRVLFLRGTSRSELISDAQNVKLTKQTSTADVFSWHHLAYNVPTPGGERQLLDDICGYVAHGKLTALMGASGAGKTTLLNVLAQRVTTGVVTGDRFVNGQALPADFQAQTGYCQQMDTHVPTDSVREALLLSAKLRQSDSVPLAEKEAYVDTCLKMCGLEAFADAAVGSLGVEHRKRTTIAVELAAKPKLLLFLDEPTSGLDSQSAWAIMSFLRSLANHGQAILCTIHQPSAELFQVFDRVLLLHKGGRTVYLGDIGHNADTLISYFQMNGARQCETGENPAEYMLSVIGAGATQDWNAIWEKSPEAAGLQQEIDAIHAEGRSRPLIQANFRGEFATSWITQFRLLLKREFLFRYRDPEYLMSKLMLNAIAALFIGFTFFKPDDSLQGTQSKVFAIFNVLIVPVPLCNQLQIPWIKTRGIYEIRERPTKMYHWTSLLAAQLLTELPWSICGGTLVFFCWYWTAGFASDRAGYTFLAVAVALPLWYTSFAQAIAAMAPDAEMAALNLMLLVSFVVDFNGVLQPYSELGWWRWMYRVSPYTYLVQGILRQAIGNQPITCSSTEFISISPPVGQTCAEYMAPYISAVGGYLVDGDSCEFCAMSSTDQFLAAGNFGLHYWRDLGIFCVFIVFNILAVYAISFARGRTRWGLKR